MGSLPSHHVKLKHFSLKFVRSEYYKQSMELKPPRIEGKYTLASFAVSVTSLQSSVDGPLLIVPFHPPYFEGEDNDELFLV